MMGPSSKRPPEWRHHLEAVEERGQLRSLLLGESSHIAVAQHLRDARARREKVISPHIPSTGFRSSEACGWRAAGTGVAGLDSPGEGVNQAVKALS